MASEPEYPTCPSCTRPMGPGMTKELYGMPVCKVCWRKFRDARYLAFLMDYFALFLLAGCLAVILAIAIPQQSWIDSLPGFLMFLLLSLKDGFSGKSPGKSIMGMTVVDRQTMNPIGRTHSFIRNSPILLLLLMIGCLDLLQSSLSTTNSLLVALLRNNSILFFIGILYMASQLMGGTRWGDGWAGTKVVWDRYADRPPFDTRRLVCPKCDYNLTGVSERCPECGQPIPRDVETSDGRSDEQR